MAMAASGAGLEAHRAAADYRCTCPSILSAFYGILLTDYASTFWKVRGIQGNLGCLDVPGLEAQRKGQTIFIE
jgi:hypothetical protein